ncbi:hypothetical protein [Kribbella antiqua]|uniref:hypothetical protein n=1 Tax=Kribbella antiqua TaxID=2512217 RepID=UPI0018EE5DA0|nr:hypothetical protein [Kribbella antiqua]
MSEVLADARDLPGYRTTRCPWQPNPPTCPDGARSAEGGPHRANAAFAFHILESLAAIDAASGQSVSITSTCDRPAPLP